MESLSNGLCFGAIFLVLLALFFSEDYFGKIGVALENNKKKVLILAILLGASGLTLPVWDNYSSCNQLRTTGVPTTAKLIGRRYDVAHGDDSGELYFVTYAFQINDIIYQREVQNKITYDSFELDKSIAIVYDPRNPKMSMLRDGDPVFANCLTPHLWIFFLWPMALWQIINVVRGTFFDPFSQVAG